jgi:hypothetical protein
MGAHPRDAGGHRLQYLAKPRAGLGMHRRTLARKLAKKRV